MLLEASRVFARSWFACCHTPAAPACAGDEEEVFELHAEAINITAGIRTVSHGRRNSLDLSRSVRVCVLTEASFVIDGSRMSIDRACPAVRWLSSGAAANLDVGQPEAWPPDWLQHP